MLHTVAPHTVYSVPVVNFTVNVRGCDCHLSAQTELINALRQAGRAPGVSRSSTAVFTLPATSDHMNKLIFKLVLISYSGTYF